MSRLVAGASVLVCGALIAHSSSRAADPAPAWKPVAAQKYLDERAEWWLGWSATPKGQETSCVSCHTTVPYALARPALTKQTKGAESPVEKKVLASVRTRVERWAEIVSAEPEGKDPLVPFYQGSQRDAALDTESVLNAAILVGHDARSGDPLSEPAVRALEHMWSRQLANGTWRWLDYGLRPWELDAEYFGTALAAVTAGTAGDKYLRKNGGKDEVERLRAHLRKKLGKQSLHNRAFALLAESHLRDVLSAEEKKQVLGDLFAAQRKDGGWGLADLGRVKPADADGWKVFTNYRNGSATKSTDGKADDKDASDGYATGLVVLALKRSGVPGGDERLKKGAAWLTAKQEEAGTWPAVYINKPRSPTDGERGQFMRDAGAAWASLALTEPND